MIKFETEFECENTDEVVYTLQEIIRQIEDGYYSGYLNDGSWSMSGEEEPYDDEEDE